MNKSHIKCKKTRFRAYQLGTDGSLFSYWVDGHFTLMEARLTDLSRNTLKDEMDICGVDFVDTLHITSWDNDHCSCNEIQELLDWVKPRKIELPGYEPESGDSNKSKKIIEKYINDSKRSNRVSFVKNISPEYISSLKNAVEEQYKDVLYNPRVIDDNCANNNSTVKIFRIGSFNVLSLGDVESSNISSRLRRCRVLAHETDILLLAHHGADNGFTSSKFIKCINPSVAICSSNQKNQYDHPPQRIRDILSNNKVPLCTTKHGDVIIESIEEHIGKYKVKSYQDETKELEKSFERTSKKNKILSRNRDSLRNYQKGKPSYRRIK